MKFKTKTKSKTATPEQVDGTEAAAIDVSDTVADAECCLTDIDCCLTEVEDESEELEEGDPEPNRANYYDVSIDWATATPQDEEAWDQGYAEYKEQYLAWASRNGVDTSCWCG